MILTPILKPLTSSPLHGLFGRVSYPSGAILHFDATLGFTDQTGNQSAVLIGSAYPAVVAGFAVNASGKEWGFSTDTGPVRTALLAGEMTLVQVVTLPLMSSLTDATDFSLYGDLLFVRRDGTAGSFKCSDGTNSAVVAYDWTEGQVVRVCVQCDGDVMRVGVGDAAAPIGSALQWPLEMSAGFVSKTGVGPAPIFSDTPTIADGGIVPGDGPSWVQSEYTQLLRYSESFLEASWNKTNCTAAQSTEFPTGFSKSFLITTTVASSIWLQRDASDVPITSGTYYIASIYAKRSNGFLQITFSGATFGASQYANFDLLNGTTGTVTGGTAGIVDIGSGWYRCWFRAVATATNASAPSPAYTLVPLSTSTRLAGATGLSAYMVGANLTTTAAIAPYVATANAAATGFTSVVGLAEITTGSRVFVFEPTADQGALAAETVIGGGFSATSDRVKFNRGAVTAEMFSLWSGGEKTHLVAEVSPSAVRVASAWVGGHPDVAAASSATIRLSDMQILNAKNETTKLNGASLTKMMTAILVDRTISDWSQPVTITSGDYVTTGVSYYVGVGDTTTIDDLVHACLMPSDNNAAQALARIVGYALDPDAESDAEAVAVAIAEMNSVAAEIGTGATYTQSWDSVNASALDQAKILNHIKANHADLLEIAGTLTHVMTITGANARTYSISHTIDPNGAVKIPEFVAGKTGTGDSKGSVAVLWEANGEDYITVIIRSDPYTERYKDLRKVMNYSYYYGSSGFVFGPWVASTSRLSGLSVAATCPGNIVEIQEWSGVYPTLSQVEGWARRQLSTVTYGEDATCDGILPLSAQIAKSHALPIGVGKITIFEGVASQAQIEEAK